MSERITRYGFAAFLILLPIQTVWLWRETFIDGAKWQYGTIGLYGTDILLLATILVSVVLFLMRGRNPIGSVIFGWFHDPINSILSFLAMWAGLSELWAEDRILAGHFFFKPLLAFGVFHLARTTKFSRKVGILLLGSVAAVASLESFLGIWQFLSQSSFASTLLGMSGHESWQAGVSVLKNESGRWLRAYGTFPHPNMFGAYLGAMLLVGIGYATFFWSASECGEFPSKKHFFSARASTRSALKKIFFVRNSALYCGFVVMFLDLLLSFSRTAWLGVLIGLCTLAYAVYMQKDIEIKRRFVKIAGVITFTAVVFVSILHEVVFPRFDGATIQKEASVIDRAVLMHQAEKIIRKYPLLGVGAGNYTLAVMQKHPEIPVWDVQPVHNVFLLVFAELGAIGVLLFIGFLVSILFQGFKSLLLEDKKESAIFFIALLSLAPSLFLDHFLWDSHFGLLFFFLLAGFSVKKFNT